jgi:hypothetical protein
MSFRKETKLASVAITAPRISQLHDFEARLIIDSVSYASSRGFNGGRFGVGLPTAFFAQ